VKKPKKAQERKLALASILFTLLAAILWVADSTFSHRLSMLQQQSAAAALVVQSNRADNLEIKIAHTESKYNEARNDLAVATKAADDAKKLVAIPPLDGRLRDLMDEIDDRIIPSPYITVIYAATADGRGWLRIRFSDNDLPTIHEE
jgi:hypothetical protein